VAQRVHAEFLGNDFPVHVSLRTEATPILRVET
jgi:hypothetical protein